MLMPASIGIKRPKLGLEQAASQMIMMIVMMIMMIIKYE